MNAKDLLMSEDEWYEYSVRDFVNKALSHGARIGVWIRKPEHSTQPLWVAVSTDPIPTKQEALNALRLVEYALRRLIEEEDDA